MTGSGEANLAHERTSAEAIVDLVAERLVVCAGLVASARVLGPHATKCGAMRMGAGPKARIGCDRAAIENGSATMNPAMRRACQPGAGGRYRFPTART